MGADCLFVFDFFFLVDFCSAWNRISSKQISYFRNPISEFSVFASKKVTGDPSLHPVKDMFLYTGVDLGGNSEWKMIIL